MNYSAQVLLLRPPSLGIQLSRDPPAFFIPCTFYPPHSPQIFVRFLLAIPARLQSQQEHVRKVHGLGENISVIMGARAVNVHGGGGGAVNVHSGSAHVGGRRRAFNINGVASISCFIGGGKKEMCVN